MFSTKVLKNCSENFIFSENYVRISIPQFQRPYVWGKEDKSDHEKGRETEELIDDTLNYSSPESYFCGAVIAFESSGDKKILEIIDGRQRLTSIFVIQVLFVHVLLKELNHTFVHNRNFRLQKLVDRIISGIKYISECEDKQKQEELTNEIKSFGKKYEQNNKIEDFVSNADTLANKIREFISKNLRLSFFKDENNSVLRDFVAQDSLRVTLKDGGEQNQLKKYTIEIEQTDEKTEWNLKRALEKNRIDALNKFKEFVTDEYQSKNSSPSSVCNNLHAEIEGLVEKIENFLNRLSLCLIVTDDFAQAGLFFEVLNKRGRELDLIDLIKNKIFYHFSKHTNADNKEEVIKNADDEWTRVFDSTNKNTPNAETNQRILTLTRDIGTSLVTGKLIDSKKSKNSAYTEIDSFLKEHENFNSVLFPQTINKFTLAKEKIDNLLKIEHSENTYNLDLSYVKSVRDDPFTCAAKFLFTLKQDKIFSFLIGVSLVNNINNSDSLKKLAKALTKRSAAFKSAKEPLEGLDEIFADIHKNERISDENIEKLMSPLTKHASTMFDWLDDFSFNNFHSKSKLRYLFAECYFWKLGDGAFSRQNPLGGQIDLDKFELDHLEPTSDTNNAHALTKRLSAAEKRRLKNSLGNMFPLPPVMNRENSNRPTMEKLNKIKNDNDFLFANHWLIQHAETLWTRFEKDENPTNFFDRRTRELIWFFKQTAITDDNFNIDRDKFSLHQR